MDRFKLDEFRNKTKAELKAELKKLKAELKKLREERSLPGAKVTDGDPNKLSEMEKLRPFLVEVAKKQKAALREAYRNRNPSSSVSTPKNTRAAPTHHHQLSLKMERERKHKN